MSENDWGKIKRIFDEAVELPKDKQIPFIKSKCGNDSGLYNEIITLLKADENPNPLLDDFVISAIDIVEEENWSGRKIGKYRIEKQIGTGGMGNVFLAHRDDGQYKQQVALKIIKRGMDSEEILNRFTAERQILARLQHPNIARLLDGGMTEQGQPYFCMEFIDGVSIIEYAEKNHLSVDNRLKLFKTVCQAVQYAQHNLVVHRDLKPSNILIDKSGTVKLLDFGIAKVLGSDTEETFISELTKTGLRVMTPGYASPEQIKGEVITTASDVYSLGVVLYELLTGRRPFKLKGLSPKQIEEMLDVSEPSKPSADLEVENKNNEPTTSRSKHEADQLRRKLSGDLDNICLMALRRDPERRYSSAGQFQDDIDRYLNGLPVRARADTLMYRSQKFISRHKTAVLSFSVILIIIISLVTFYTWQLANERDRAREEALKSEQVTEFLTSLFDAANPNISKGEEITARDLLEQGAKRIETELADQPQVKADMLLLIGAVYGQIGDLELSREFYLKALNDQVAITGEVSEQTMDIYRSLGTVEYDLGNYDSSVAEYDQAVNIAYKIFDEDDIRTADCLNDLATSLRVMGQNERAEKIFRKCLNIRLQEYGEMNLDVAHTMNHLGRLLYTQNRQDEARPLLEKGLQIRRSMLGNENFETIASMGTMSQWYRSMGHYDSALTLTTAALNNLIKLVGTDHHYVGGMSNQVGNIYRELGDYENALKYDMLSLDILEKILPNEHVNISFPLEGLGFLFFDLKKYDSSIMFFERALNLRRDNFDKDNIQILVLEIGLAHSLIYVNQFEKAEQLLLRAKDILPIKYSPDHEHAEQTNTFLYELYTRWGKPEKAELYKVYSEQADD